MKMAKKKSKDMQQNLLKPAIPFTRAPVKKFKCGKYHAYNLRTVLGDSSSPVYKLSTLFFAAGTPEE
jgi:hypothetical protein